MVHTASLEHGTCIHFAMGATFRHFLLLGRPASTGAAVFCRVYLDVLGNTNPVLCSKAARLDSDQVATRAEAVSITDPPLGLFVPFILLSPFSLF